MAELKTIPIAKIVYPDVRVSSILDEEQKALMASTIREVGVVQEPVVRPLPDGFYECITGKSRIQELVEQGKTEVQVKVIEADEKLGLIMNITENVARGNYDYISIAKSIRKLKQLGSTSEQLERIFPWSKRWIDFIDDLQDLPEDVQGAISARKITPTHVLTALSLPTPYEVHDALKSAITLEWDSSTLKTFVTNRIEQITRAQKEAAERGVEPEIPQAKPLELIQYKQCLLCGFKKPVNQIQVQLICDDCSKLVRYITSQVGPPEQAITVVYQALAQYYGQPYQPSTESVQPTEEPQPT